LPRRRPGRGLSEAAATMVSAADSPVRSPAPMAPVAPLRRLALWYFFYFAFLGAFGTYFSLYLKSLACRPGRSACCFRCSR
jgi:hypothetical protein